MARNRIIILAYAVYPNIQSSEGIVNRNWIDIISKNNDLVVLDSDSIQYFENNDFEIKEDLFLKSLKETVKGKRIVSNFLYRLFNKFFLQQLRNQKVNNLYAFLWVKRQKGKIIKNQVIDSNSVYWARLLPTFSLLPLLQLHQKIKIPIIVNVNDPLENDFFSEEIILQSKPIVQSWTFPSYQLAKEFSDKYQIDLDNCFVIPHAMKEQENLYQNSFNKDKLNFLYTGTLYRGAFTETFLKQLNDFSKTTLYNQIQITFVLSQFDLDFVQLLKKTFPNIRILTNLPREEVLKMVIQADCMLVIDAKDHINLLKGKLAEAISFGIPVFSVSYKGSAMDEIVSKYGGFSSYQDVDNHILNNLQMAVENLKNTIWNRDFLEKRVEVMNYFSEKNISDLTIKITKLTIDRFNS
jgi:glycosyltransferase involved in cell wall biosynthesis